jgi:lysophospholipase L1-like esterase
MRNKTAFVFFVITLLAILAAFSIYDKNPENKPGDKKVVAFGDSLTYGFGDEEGSGYIDTLDRKLNDQNKEEFDFTNEAIYGLESSGVLKQMSDIRVSSKLDDADYFIVFIGTNDLINSNGGNLNSPNHESIDKGKEVYLQNLKAIVNILTKNNEDAPILVLGLYNPYPESGQIEAILDDWNKDLIQTIQNEERISYIPTNDLFKGKDKKDYFSDSLHLNDKGYNLVADRILAKYDFK